jgi:hypothetical protein
LFVACWFLALQFLGCIGSFNDRISSFSIFNERIILSFGLPLNRFVVMSLSFSRKVGPHSDIFLQRVDFRQSTSCTTLHYVLCLLLFCKNIRVALGVIKFILTFVLPLICFSGGLSSSSRSSCGGNLIMVGFFELYLILALSTVRTELISRPSTFK